jgi:1-aminocyclopropane-1-carboxylate deaminase
LKIIRFESKLTIKFPNSISVTIKREDLIHPFVSGNKFRKLKYNLLQAKVRNTTSGRTILMCSSFAGKGFKTIGIVRGDECDKIALIQPYNLHKAWNAIQFVSREGTD